MKKVKRIVPVLLTLLILLANIPVVSAKSAENLLDTQTIEESRILAAVYFVDGEVYVECEVVEYSTIESIDVLFVLREENAAGNLVIMDTWSDGASGNYFYEEYCCGTATAGKEYEVSVRVGVYDSEGLVEYRYITADNTYNNNNN